jgi:hypothetical protein
VALRIPARNQFLNGRGYPLKIFIHFVYSTSTKTGVGGPGRGRAAAAGPVHDPSLCAPALPQPEDMTQTRTVKKCDKKSKEEIFLTIKAEKAVKS